MDDRPAKKRIALFGVGILGGGPRGEGVPVLAELFTRLCGNYRIAYYSFSRVYRHHVPEDIALRQLATSWLPGRIKYGLLLTRAIVDHLLHPFSLVFSVSAYPSGYFAILFGKVIGRPVVVQLIAGEAVDLREMGYGNLGKPFLGSVTRTVCRKATALIAVAEYQRDVAVASLPTSRVIEVLPLRINPSKFIYRKRKLTYPVRFIHVAYYSKVKDQETLFEAFALVARQVDCYLTVVGDGFHHPLVTAILNNLDIVQRVNCVDFVRYDEISPYYDQAHILLHTARYETGCAVIQEAMASGVAVCGTNVGLLSDLGSRYAVVSPVGDAPKLAHDILQLIGDPSRFETITQEAYEWIRQFGAGWSAKRYRELIDDQINSWPSK